MQLGLKKLILYMTKCALLGIWAKMCHIQIRRVRSPVSGTAFSSQDVKRVLQEAWFQGLVPDAVFPVAPFHPANTQGTHQLMGSLVFSN